MAKALELIKESVVSERMMRSAATGVLELPAVEVLEILIYLLTHPVFGEEANRTLSKWDVSSCLEVFSDPDTPREVLDYFTLPKNRRQELMPMLMENKATSAQTLMVMAQTATRDDVEILLASARVQSLPEVQKVLLENPNLLEPEREKIREGLGSAIGDAVSVVDHSVDLWIVEHAPEIAAEEGKPFTLVAGSTGEELATDGKLAPVEVTEEALAKAAVDAVAKPEEAKRLSILQKLSKMSVGERVKVAMIGNKEQRNLLIRDGSRIVSSAVLASPKVSEQEIQSYAGMKNVQESVMREIARNRKFMKDYIVTKSLVNNPRCPLDISLNLVKNLIVTDLRTLQMNKNVSETLRKIATKLYKERSTPVGQKPN